MTSLSDAMAACARQAALQQRARLLGAVWDDVQSERRAIHTGALPARLLTLAASGRAPLERYSAHLLCCPDGVWRVARDHVGRHAGAALLEAPILAAFLPDLCRLLLGETLLLASLPAWWLGEPQIWTMLAANSRRFSIRDGLDPESHPVALAGLPPDRRRWLQNAITADPHKFVAGLDLGWRFPIQHVSCDTGRARAKCMIDLGCKIILTVQ